MKDIKVLLKEAREAIKNKDYDASLRLSKIILREDKSNYMGLIFLGLSLQEKGPKDQAPKAFQKAVEQNPENPLGWNGLISYYEKLEDSEETKRELLKCYCAALRVETGDKKIQEYSEKALNLYKYGNDATEICDLIYEATKSDKLPEQTSTNVLKLLVDFLENFPEKNRRELLELYEKCLSDLVNNPTTVNQKYYSYYLTVLNKLAKLEDVIIEAEKMHNLFETDTLSLSWICKIFNQSYVEDNNELVEKYSSKVKEFCEKVLDVESNNGTAMFTKAIFLTEEKKTLEAKHILSEVTAHRPGLIHAWAFLTAVYLKLNLFQEAPYSLQKMDKLLQSINYSNTILKNKMDMFRIELMSNTDDVKDWNAALDLYKNLQDKETKIQCLPFAIRANINLERYAESKLLILDLKNTDPDKARYLNALLLRKQKNYVEALKVLEENTVDSANWWLEIGLLYWDLEEYDKCLMPFLKQTKCDPNNYLCFLYLGNYYRNINDNEKARRCYERAFHINQKSSEAGTELSRIYRKQKNWEANLNLLHTVTSGAINKNNLWACLQLGLHYLEQEDYVKAIENLRYVVRIDSTNMHCWESLGDAYFARGAYTSALKCYQKALELSDNALYPSLQVANIKKILGEFSVAKADFEEILFRSGQYVPALKGLAETSLSLARECNRDQRLGTARDHAQYALEKLSVALQQRSDLSCLWKLLADCCFIVAKLPEKYCCLFVPKTLVEGEDSDGNALLEKDELFTFAAKCYCKSISLVENSILLWHDLGTCYLYHAMNTENTDKKEQLFNYALAAAHYCCSQETSSWQHWNLLGNVAFCKDPPDYALAQHAFIKAVTADHNSAISWCNLGILYFLMEDINLANEAFTQGQRSDPNYINSWLGQAIIAEKIGHEDAMDLFRHSTQLGQHQQGSVGYGHWVCQVLLDAPPGAEIYAIHGMHAVPVACDALTWYTEKNPYDACAWNMLGILKERLGLTQGASDAFRHAYRLSSKDYRDKARINYGRLLAKSERYPEAIDMFQAVEEASFKSGSGLALALFKDKQYEESYNKYEQALHWLTEDQTYQSDLLVALASMAYMFQGPHVAKTLLFQSIALKPPSPWSLYATLALGLVHKDLKLAKLVLNELEALKDRSDCIPHYVTMLSFIYLIKGEHDRAVKEVSKIVHRQPQEAATWLTLALLLLRLHKERKPSPAGSKCAIAAMKLGRAKMDVTKVWCLVSQGSLLAGNKKQALVFAQKAVHCYPNIAEGWSVLSSVLMQKKGKSLPHSHIKTLLKHVELLDSNSKLNEWSLKCQEKLSVK